MRREGATGAARALRSEGAEGTCRVHGDSVLPRPGLHCAWRTMSLDSSLATESGALSRISFGSECAEMFIAGGKRHDETQQTQAPLPGPSFGRGMCQCGWRDHVFDAQVVFARQPRTHSCPSP